MGIADAAYEEITPGASHLVSSKMAWSLAGICESITFDPKHGSITAVGPDGEERAIELRDHPFFVATLFLLQLSSSGGRPHPLIGAFLRGAAEVTKL